MTVFGGCGTFRKQEKCGHWRWASRFYSHVYILSLLCLLVHIGVRKWLSYAPTTVELSSANTFPTMTGWSPQSLSQINVFPLLLFLWGIFVRWPEMKLVECPCLFSPFLAPFPQHVTMIISPLPFLTKKKQKKERLLPLDLSLAMVCSSPFFPFKFISASGWVPLPSVSAQLH